MKKILLNFTIVLLLNCWFANASNLLNINAKLSTQYDFIVAADGSGTFKTVQEAINAVPDFRKVTTTIFIKNGIYKEKLNLSASKQMVKMIGESVDKTILTYDDWAQKKNTFGEEKGTSGSASFYVYGAQFSAENITFQNTAGPVGQAVALFVAAIKLNLPIAECWAFKILCILMDMEVANIIINVISKVRLILFLVLLQQYSTIARFFAKKQVI